MTAQSATSGWARRWSSTSIDETFSPPLTITSFLRSVIVTWCSSSMTRPVARVQPPVAEGVGAGAGVVPVAFEHVVRPRQQLPVGVDPQAHADGREPLAGHPAGGLLGREVVVLGRAGG